MQVLRLPDGIQINTSLFVRADRVAKKKRYAAKLQRQPDKFKLNKIMPTQLEHTVPTIRLCPLSWVDMPAIVILVRL